MSDNNSRCRSFCFVLYPDCESHMVALDTMCHSYDIAYILHDKDVDSDGVLKKPHYHVVIRFKQPRWKSALAKEIGIEENYIEPTSSFNNALMYLIHFNDLDKYQYDVSLVKGNLKTKLNDILNSVDKSENEVVLEIMQFIADFPTLLNVTLLSKFCATVGYWSVYRRSAFIFIKLLEEHNVEILQHNNMQ